MKTIALTLVAFFLALQINTFAQSTLTKVPISSRNFNPFGYVEYLPSGFDVTGNTKYPILFWFNGLGEDGDGLDGALTTKILNRNINNWLKTHDIPFIVLSPQSFNGFWEGNPLRTLTFLEWVKIEYADFINTDQIHFAGLSAGGYGVAKLVEFAPEVSTFTFMSTNTNKANGFVQNIIDNDQYVWFHQGLKDNSPNHVEAVTSFFEGIYKEDPSRVRLTVYTNLGHSAWNEVYDNSGMTTAKETGTYTNKGQDYPYFNWTTADETWYEWMLARGKDGPITSIKNNSESSNISLSPNPVNQNNLLVLNSESSDLTSVNLVIYDNIGKQVPNNKLNITPTSIEINTKEMQKGVYYMNLNGTEVSKMIKFVVQ